MSTSFRLPTLATTLPLRFAKGRRGQPRSAHTLFSDVLAGNTTGLGLLDWLHILRHQPLWETEHPDKADQVAEQMWTIAADNPSLQGQLLGRLVEGMCGGEGLSPAMLAACQRLRPLEKRDPLLQEIITALSRVSEDPQQLIALCMTHNRAPRALLARAGLPTDLSLLDPVEAAIPHVMRTHTSDTRSARKAAQWLLMSLREAPLDTRDRIAEGLLSELSAPEARALPDLCWWLSEAYGEGIPESRWSALSKTAQQALKTWT